MTLHLAKGQIPQDIYANFMSLHVLTPGFNLNSACLYSILEIR